MLWSILDFAAEILSYQKVDIVSAMSKVLRSISIIDQVFEVFLIVVHI
jgi:hypothetical protein